MKFNLLLFHARQVVINLSTGMQAEQVIYFRICPRSSILSLILLRKTKLGSEIEIRKYFNFNVFKFSLHSTILLTFCFWWLWTLHAQASSSQDAVTYYVQ